MLSLFVTCPKGVENLLRDELQALGADSAKASVAACFCECSLEVAYRICLSSRLANRVVLLLLRHDMTDNDGLLAAIAAQPWSEYFSCEQRIAVDFHGSNAQIRDRRYGAQLVKDGLNQHFHDAGQSRLSVDTESPDVWLYARLFKHRALVGIDLVGYSLHRRGYRVGAAPAPLKENLAAALLTLAAWPRAASDGALFVDPMCGSGTLLIEAAFMRAQVPAACLQLEAGDCDEWVLTRLQNFVADEWRSECDAVRERYRNACDAPQPLLFGYDCDGAAIDSARSSIEAAGLQQLVHVEQCALEQLQLPESAQRGMLLTNPPYGERLGEVDALREDYRQLGALLRRDAQGWQAAVFTGNAELGWEIGLRSFRQHRLANGAIPCQLLRYRVDASSEPPRRDTNRHPVPTLEELSEGATMVANRLQKNRRKLKRWLASMGEGCSYRIYDADLPEYAAAIDCYVARSSGKSPAELYLHIQAYQPPASIDVAAAKQRLRDVIAAAQAVFAVPRERTSVKRRERQRGKSQYQKREPDSPDLWLDEQGHTLKVNLGRYLDTGLFLDHRGVRRHLAKFIKARCGQRDYVDFLNLYSYTASATVYAAMAGATESVSIDLSNSYLEWAADNYAANDIDPERHRLTRADCREWLQGHSRQFDCILLDPPSFSNSKKVSGTLDIQRDHGELIDLAMAHLKPGGRLYFSTNKRGFKLDATLAQRFALLEITEQTLDADFSRPPPAHRCWQLEHPADGGARGIQN